MKTDKITEVTAKNFDEFEKTLFACESRNGKERAAWGILKPLSDLVFFFLFLSATCQFLAETGLPVFPALRPIASLWGDLGAGKSPLSVVIICILGIAFVSCVLHAIPAAILKRVWPGKPFAPVPGSELEKAEALEKRFKENCKSFLLNWTTWSIVAYPVIAFAPLVLDKEWNQTGLDEIGVLLYILEMAVLFAMFALAYVIPYVGYTMVCLIGYQTFDGCAEQGKMIHQYVNRLQSEQEKQRETEKKEKERLQGDALYRQATAGGAVDEGLVAQAAELGSRPACLYIGQRLLKVWYEGQYTMDYTKDELKEMAELALGYFKVAREEKMLPVSQIVAELGYLVFWEETQKLNMSMFDWKRTLEQLRKLRASGMLPKSYGDIYDFAVETAVTRIDMIAEHERWINVRTSDSSSSGGWNTMHDDLDAVERSLGGPGWSDGV